MMVNCSVMKSINFLLTALFFSLICCAASAEPVHRHILAVIDGSEERVGAVIQGDAIPGTEAYVAGAGGASAQGVNIIEQYAETPLNHLGYIVDYVDVTKRLPDDAEMQKYDAIFSWFQDNKLKGAADYGRWITKQLEKGKKLIVFDEFGFDLDDKENPTPEKEMGDFYKAFSVSYNPGDTTDSPLLIEVAQNDPQMTEFERNLKGGLINFIGVAVQDKGARVFLKLRRKDTGATSDAVFIHSKGAYVLPGYVIYVNPGDQQTRWRINPFKFFAEALKSDFPKPDITTLNGMRIFFSHIDGDGVESRSLLETGKICGEVAYERILKKYKLPVSASLIVGSIIGSRGDERERLVETIKRIFALPNVEPASHGWAHPLVWSGKKRKMAFRLPGYTYSPENEIGNSIKYINDNLTPAGKKTNLFFWTGDCMPDYEALKYVYDYNIMAINGGDARFDNGYPSYAYVSSLFRHVGELLQDHSSNANEIIYTNIWTGPFYGYRYVTETFERTESPMRVRAIGVYYHYFSLERESSAQALEQVYDWALAHEIAPVFASEYLKNLNGFLSAKIERLSDGKWIVSDTGSLRTVRFDNYKGFVDIERSKGVLGFLPYQGSLYVHLDNGERSEIVLTGARPSLAYLAKADGMVKNWKAGAGAVDFELHAIGRVQFVIGGLAASRNYTVTVQGTSAEIKSDAAGNLNFSRELDDNRFEWIAIAIKEG